MFIRFMKSVFLAFFLVSLSGCNSPELKPLAANATILAFGDSLTAGVGTSRDKSYPAVLQELSGIKVINRGISGETTAEGLTRFEEVLDQSTPDLIILIEGGNDILRNRPYSDIKANLNDMIGIARSRNIQLVFLGIPEKKLFSSSAPFYQQLADEHQLVYDHNLISDLLRTRNLKSDPIHFNQAGYRKMAEAIHQLLIESGAL